MSGPSEKAVQAATEGTAGRTYDEIRRDALDRAYPIIREDVIREVVARIRQEGAWTSPETMAVLIEREFGALNERGGSDG